MQKQKNLKELTTEWYKKLEKSGFQDAEINNQYMHEYAGWFKAKHTPETFQEKQDYYLLLFQLLERGTFKNKKEKRIWEMHANAIGVRGIAKTITRLYGKKHSKNKIVKLLKTIKERFHNEGLF